jgi:hypothetical protein
MRCLPRYPVVIRAELPDRAGNSQYPAHRRGHGALGLRQNGLQEGREAAVVIRLPKPSDAIGVILVTRGPAKLVRRPNNRSAASNVPF